MSYLLRHTRLSIQLYPREYDLSAYHRTKEVKDRDLWNSAVLERHQICMYQENQSNQTWQKANCPNKHSIWVLVKRNCAFRRKKDMDAV